MDIIQLMRMKRSATKAEPRKRHLRDLIQLALLYKREGLLSMGDASKPDFLSRAAEELSVAASISLNGATDVLKLVRIRENDDAWAVLTDCHNLGIFEAENYIGSVGKDEEYPCFCLSFLERFVDCEEASIASENSQNLDCIAACFTKEARSRIVTIFLKFVSVIGTLSSCFPENTVIDKFKATNIIERYLSKSWTSETRQKQYHSFVNHRHAHAGWLIVTEVFKVQVQELLLWKKRRTAGNSSASATTAQSAFINEDDLKDTAHVFCHNVVVEFFAWVFHFCLRTETVNSFSGSICDVIDRVNENLAREIGCERKELIPGGLILTVLDGMKANAPTMAEIRYGAEDMIPMPRDDKPTRLLSWDGREVILRCRWNGSLVTTIYRNFLEKCRKVELTPQRDQEGNVIHSTNASLQLTTSSMRISPQNSRKRRRPVIDDLRGCRPAQRLLHNNNLNEHGRFNSQCNQAENSNPPRQQRPLVRHPREDSPHRVQTRLIPHNNGGPPPPPHHLLPGNSAHHFDPHGHDNPPPQPRHGPPFDAPDHCTPPRRAPQFDSPSRFPPGHHDGRGFRLLTPQLPRRRPPFPGPGRHFSGPEHRIHGNRQPVPPEFVNDFSRHDGPSRINQNETPKKLPNYLNDGEGSDSEGDDYNEDGDSPGNSEFSKQMNEALQKLYITVLSWPIFHAKREREFLQSGRRRPLNISEKLSTHLLTGMKPWLRVYVEREKSILTDATTAKDLSDYNNHWKALLPLEIRASVQDSLASMLPQCKEGIKKRFQDELEADTFVACVVRESTPSAGLVNLTCVSTQPLVNRRIVEELQGGTICVGYISSQNSSTDLILIGCRRVHWEAEDIIHMGDEQHIGRIELRLVVSRIGVRENGVWPENRVHLRHLSHFAPFLRMSKALEETSRLPVFIQQTLFGNNCPVKAADSGNANQLVDYGCARYLEGLKSSSAKVDDPQMDALRSVLANVGNCAAGSSSFSLIHGPPGTGKTTTILHLIGALMHHSLVGHVGREQRNDLKDYIPSDNIERHRESPGGIRILVCAPSNKGVDNILERLALDGIPDGKGGKFWPQAARIARARYDHAAMYEYSLDQKALPFDHYIHNVGANKKTSSSKARKSFFRECVIVLTTLVSSGGSTFRNCKVPFDVVITDEIGQACEPETLIAMTNAAKRSDRCHFVGVGDHRQLPPISLASHAMKCIAHLTPFDYDKQMVSIFQRIHDRNRASSRMLTMQYRMCRAVADMNNLIFYDGLLKSSLPESVFEAPYNKGWDSASGCFARMTFIDTTPMPLRRERSSKDGEYINIEEISVINEVLHKIKILAGSSFGELKREIAVLVPYRSQVAELRLVLERMGKYVRNGVSRQGFDILVDSVNSMQGSERDVIIFATTRSNLDRKVAFLEKPNRLNVATSRAKKLQIIIGDMSTLDVNHQFARMKEFCQQRHRKDAVFLQLHETTKEGMMEGLKELTC